jgi:hypothetical protein
MSLTFSHLKQIRPQLEPVPVDIGGLSQPLLVHQFTMSQMAKVLEANDGSKDDEIVVRNQVLKFLNGADYEPTDEDRTALVNIFAGWQVREIYLKSLKLNGYGPDSLREAEKN